LYYAAKENITLEHKKIGFIAYGSGSKSKVFEGEIQAEWKNNILKTSLFEILEHRTAIDFETYEKLHKKEQKESVLTPKKEFILKQIEKENPLLKGARYYQFMK